MKIQNPSKLWPLLALVVLAAAGCGGRYHRDQATPVQTMNVVPAASTVHGVDVATTSLV